jgi:hypothetical protein
VIVSLSPGWGETSPSFITLLRLDLLGLLGDSSLMGMALMLTSIGLEGFSPK